MPAPRRELLREYLKLASSTDQKIRDSNSAILTLLEDCENLIINIIFKGWREPGYAGFPLAMNAYYLFLASVRTSISGHPAAVFPTLRSALESACYAVVIFDDEKLFTVWRNRHKNEVDLKAQKKVFAGAVSQAAKLASTYNLDMGDLVRELYEASIDYGGHPNPRTMAGHLRLGKGGFNDIEEFGCLYEPKDPRTGAGMLACVDFAIAIAFLLACPLDAPYSTKKLVPDFNRLLEMKDVIATQLHGSPIDYGSEMYSRFDKP